MTEKERLIFHTLRKLDILETEENQSQVNYIRGILYELLDIL